MKINTISMRYTYLFTQISRREENGELVPVTDNPYEFVFTFGNQINKVLGKSPDSDNTVLLTKDMWKEYPANNKELLQTVCFSTPSLKGYTRPLVMSKEADKRVGVYLFCIITLSIFCSFVVVMICHY